MKIFAIRDASADTQKDLAYLLYYEIDKRFYIELPEDADPWETPLLLSGFARKGENTVNAYWSRIWVQQRIVPPDRQNIGQILRDNGLSVYDEYALLMLSAGRCEQDDYYLVPMEESALGFCRRMGWSEYIWNMLVVDFLILNRDRHGANIEVLRNKKEKTIRLAPLFDHGLSLLCRCETAEAIDSFDVMADLPIQCFVGSRSAQENLKLIPVDDMPKLNALRESDKDILLEGFCGIIPQNLQEKIWDMIWKRWCYYEDFCHSGRIR